MQDTRDTQTLDILGAKHRGRPSTGKALSGAERVRKHREKRKSELWLFSVLYGFSGASDADLIRWLSSELAKPTQGVYAFRDCLKEIEARHAKRS
jgi:hypothetical protein